MYFCAASFAHPCPTTTTAIGSVRIEQQLRQTEHSASGVEKDLAHGEVEGRALAGVQEGLRDVFGDCEEDFGETEGFDLGVG